jgi:hypothetical protein
MVLDDIKKKRERENHARRCYPSTEDTQVYQYTDDPSVYVMSSGFAPARDLAKYIDMPVGDDVYYVSSTHRGSSFVNSNEKSLHRYKKYTVEYFGLKIKPQTSEPHLLPLSAELPSSSQFSSEPIYIWEDSSLLVQVWRWRVFYCTLQSLDLELSRPFTPSVPKTPYLEERWHPTEGSHLLFGNVKQKGYTTREVNQFIADAHTIVWKGAKKGRGFGSGYFPSRRKFLKKAREAYKEVEDLGNGRPTQPIVATYMGISYSCFKYNKSYHKVVWPDQFM